MPAPLYAIVYVQTIISVLFYLFKSLNCIQFIALNNAMLNENWHFLNWYSPGIYHKKEQIFCTKQSSLLQELARVCCCHTKNFIFLFLMIDKQFLKLLLCINTLPLKFHQVSKICSTAAVVF